MKAKQVIVLVQQFNKKEALFICSESQITVSTVVENPTRFRVFLFHEKIEDLNPSS